MNRHQTSLDGGSIVRSLLVGTGVIALVAMGQWVAAAALSVSYGSVDVLARLRRSLRRRQPPAALPLQAGSATSTEPGRSDARTHSGTASAPRDHELAVERRPRT